MSDDSSNNSQLESGEVEPNQGPSEKVARRPSAVRGALAVSRQDIVLFDLVYQLFLPAQIEEASQAQPQLASEIEYLRSRGVVESLNLNFTGANLGHLNGDSPEAFIASRPRYTQEERDFYLRHPNVVGDMFVDLVAHTFQEDGEPVLPLYGRSPDEPRLVWSPRHVARGNLCVIAIENMPVFERDTPLEAVVDFAQDPETVAMRRRLVRRINRAELAEEEPQRFRLDLEEAIENYTDLMRLTDMRRRSGGMTVVLALTGAVEELLHLRPRKAIEAVVKYREIKADDRERRRFGVGNEAALFYEVERKFGRS